MVTCPIRLTNTWASMKRRASIALALLGVPLAGAVFLWPTPPAGGILKPGDRDVTAEGARVYASYCSSCHGADLEGQPGWMEPGPDGRMPAPPHDDTGHTWHHSDALLIAITKFGTAEAAGLSGYESDMPAFETDLTDEQIIAVLSYIKATWPDEIRERHDALNAAIPPD